MPTSSPHSLIWSEARQQYELQSVGQIVRRFRLEDEPAFSCWLTEHSAFSFVGQAGRLSVVKETRPRGTGYWYASRKQDGHTRKRYLGRADSVTFARLEQVAKLLASTSSPAASGLGVAAPSFEQSGVMLISKFSPPRLPISLVERSHLLSELDAIYAHPLMLLSASAGSGKTTLISTWISQQGDRHGIAGHDPAIVWLSLETLDNEMIRYWASVITALRIRLPKVGEASLALLHAQEALPYSTVLSHLIDEIRQTHSDVVLVLDDYHVIEDAHIHESMQFFIDHLPPALHVVLASRTDPALPLSRWRVRGQLAEIRSGDMRFNPSETTNFLLHSMHLSLSETDVNSLHQRTEGWIAGLQLAALSLRKQDDPSGWIADFAGNYRYLLDYVQEDILARLPISLQQFLLQTSLLTRMNATVCQAITATPSQQTSQEILAELERANLFVVPLDEQRQWYRYHDLFREALRARLYASQPELAPILHNRAAHWYASQGKWHEAITHALAAPDYPLAASFIEQAAPHFWFNGEARTVHAWVLTLPDGDLAAHMHLALNAALRFLNSVHISTESVHASMAAEVQRTLKRVENVLSSHHASSVPGTELALVMRRMRLLSALIEVRTYFRRGNKERLRLLTQEIEALPPDEDISWKLIPLSFAFWLTLAFQHDIALLIPRFHAAKQWIGDARDYLVAFRVMTWLTRAYIHTGQLRLARQECTEAFALLNENGGSAAIAGYLYSSLFDISYAWNRLDEASDALRHLLRIARDWQQVELLALGERAAAQLALARGDLETAQESLAQAEAVVEREEFVNNARWVIEIRIQVWLASHELDEANRWAAQSTLSTEDWDPIRNWEALLLARVLIAQQRYSQAIDVLERFKGYYDPPADIEKMIEWMALYLVTLHHTGQRRQALNIAAQLFAMTEPEGYVRLFLDAGAPMRQALEAIHTTEQDTPQESGDSPNPLALFRPYASRLLEAFAQEDRKRNHDADAPFAPMHQIPPGSLASQTQKPPIEPLSRQELRVLRLLVAGHTYAEMAESLVVSTNTVKTQVSSIYRKLNVRRRAEAIAATTQLHLL